MRLAGLWTGSHVCPLCAGFESPSGHTPSPSAPPAPPWQGRSVASSKLWMLEFSAFLERQQDPDTVGSGICPATPLPLPHPQSLLLPPLLQLRSCLLCFPTLPSCPAPPGSGLRLPAPLHPSLSSVCSLPHFFLTGAPPPPLLLPPQSLGPILVPSALSPPCSLHVLVPPSSTHRLLCPCPGALRSLLSAPHLRTPAGSSSPPPPCPLQCPLSWVTRITRKDQGS